MLEWCVCVFVCVYVWTCRQLQRTGENKVGEFPLLVLRKPPGSKSGTWMLQGWWANHILGPWCGKPWGWPCFQLEPGLIAMCLSRPKASLSGSLLSEQHLKASSYFFMPWKPLLDRQPPSAGPSLFCKGRGWCCYLPESSLELLLYKWMEHKNQVKRSPGLSLQSQRDFCFQTTIIRALGNLKEQGYVFLFQRDQQQGISPLNWDSGGLSPDRAIVLGTRKSFPSLGLWRDKDNL